MIRKPFWLQDRLRETAGSILNDEATITEAADELAEKIVANDRLLTLLIVVDKVKSWLKQEMHKLVRAATRITEEEGETGQLAFMALPFPWLRPTWRLPRAAPCISG